MAENNRYNPYVRRRQYRAWLRDENPTPPRATASRYRRRRELQNEIAAEVNNDVANVRIDLNGAAENVQVVDEDLAQEGELLEEEEIDSASCSSRGSSFQGDENEEMPNDVNQPDEGNGEVREDERPEDEVPPDNFNERWRPTRMPELDESIFPPLTCTKFECLLMIMSFAFRHGLTQVAIHDLCELVNKIFGGKYIPTSEHFLKKIFGKSEYVYHFYCSHCLSYLSEFRNTEALTGYHVCGVCSTRCTFSNMNNGNFFITFSMKDQLRFLLENTDDVMSLLNHRWERNVEHGIISDVYDGKIYSDLAAEGNFLSSRYNLSITFNTDGASVFDATKNTLWPIHFCLNEFPSTVRFNKEKIMTAGIWFGKCEPKMPLFLSTFVNEVNDLYENGFVWKSPAGHLINSKVVLLNCVADSKAKPLLQGVKMHNGYYGCGYCLHPGVMFDGSNQAKYPVNDDLILMQDSSFSYTVSGLDPTTKAHKVFAVEDRSNESIRRNMEAAELNRTAAGDGHVFGVKEKSILWGLAHFDLSFGFVVDYMHAVLLGVAKHTTGLWFDTLSHGQLYYIGMRSKEVDSRLLKIKPPVTISRRPRTLDERVHWKANEWRTWLLFYSLPCLLGILPNRYLKHHCLLVTAIHMLLREKISRSALEKACCFLGHYCSEFKTLYGGSLMYFNVHLLLHLGKCVDLWGPLYCFSAFSFETANACLINLVKGTRGVLSQIANKYMKCRIIPYSVELYDVSDSTMAYCTELFCYRFSKVSYRHEDITVLGNKKTCPLNEEEREAISASGHKVTSESYERMIRNGVMYHARCYSRKGDKSDSSVVLLVNCSACVLERIIDPENFRGEGEPKFLALVREVNVTFNHSIVKHAQGANAEHIKQCAPIVYGRLKVITVDEINCLLILMDCIDNVYIAKFPNFYEKD